MRKTTFILLLLAIWIVSTGVGCLSAEFATEDQNQTPINPTGMEAFAPKQTKTIPKETEEESTRYTDAVLGISFIYPTNWGPINIQEEGGFFGQIGEIPTNENGQILYDGTVHRALLFSGLGDSHIFLVAHSQGEPAGRGGYFGDLSNQFHSAESVSQWCTRQINCEYFTNANGIRIVHAYTPEREEWGQKLKDIDEYAIVHPDHPFGGIIISNQRFVEKSLGRQEKELRMVVDSIVFSPLTDDFRQTEN